MNFALQHQNNQYTQQEIGLQNAVASTIMPVTHMEKEWDAEKLRKKICEYLSKSGKKVATTGRSWEKLIEDFAYRFMEAFWRALGDREYVEMIDFSFVIQQAIPIYYPEPEIMSRVGSEEYRQGCQRATEYAFDSCRYATWGFQIMKNVMGPKSFNQKKVRDALDQVRDQVVKQRQDSAESFMRSWIVLTVETLAKSGNPHSFLSKTDATTLFNDMIQEGGGIPLPLIKLRGSKPPRDWEEVTKSVDVAYDPFPLPQAAPPQNSWGGKGGCGFGGDGFGGKGWGGGFDNWCGKGTDGGFGGGAAAGKGWGGGGGGESWGPGMDQMWAMMSAMMSGKGEKGYSPY